MRARRMIFGLLCSATAWAFVGLASAQSYKADGHKAKGYIEYLSTDQFQGRMTLTPEYQKAAEWVAARFKEWGLLPCGDGGTSYFHKVPISRPVTVNIGTPAFSVDGRPFSLDDSDYTLQELSTAKTAVKAEAVFVGYGISLPAKGLDEYAGIDVKGKVVLAYKGSPESFAKPRGFFDETVDKLPAPLGLTPEETADAAKIKTAYDKGAAAVLLYNPDPAPVSGGFMMGGFPPGPAPQISRNFLVFDITERIFRSLVKKAPQESMSEYGKKIAALRWEIRNKKPRSKATGAVASLKGYDEVKKYSGDAPNVIAKIEGVDPALKNQYIVLGGHLDHVGSRGSVVRNGADDDASGVAVVMEVARVLSQAGFQPKRTIVFAGWCGEEMGLLGSNHFGNKPPAGITMDQVVANFNLDMVGLGDNLDAPGALNFPEIYEKVIKRNQDPDVIAVVKPSIGGPGGSDHSTFITKGIVSMALMTGGGGGHPDYHDSGDDTYKIDAEILRKVSQFVLQGTMNLADETAVNLIVPERLYLYNSLMMRFTNINTALPGATWKNSDFLSRGALLTKMSEAEIRRTAQAQAQAALARSSGPVFFPSGSPAPTIPTPIPPMRKDLAMGARSQIFGGDVKLFELGTNMTGFGRLEFAGDDDFWVVDGRLTEAGKAAIKTAEANRVVLHLADPADDLLSDVLTVAEKPLIITGIYHLTPATRALVVSKKAVMSVDFDPNDVAASVARADQVKKEIGAAANLVVYVKALDKLSDLDAKRAFYFGLIRKGWTVDEINAFVGGSLRALTNLGMVPSAR